MNRGVERPCVLSQCKSEGEEFCGCRFFVAFFATEPALSEAEGVGIFDLCMEDHIFRVPRNDSLHSCHSEPLQR